MDINITLLGEMLTFLVLLWFMGRYIWPQLTAAIKAREARIREGLDAAAESQAKLTEAALKSAELLKEARLRATVIRDEANHEAVAMIEDAKLEAQRDAAVVRAAAKAQLKVDAKLVKEQLAEQTSELALQMVEKLLDAKVLPQDVQQRLLDEELGKL